METIEHKINDTFYLEDGTKLEVVKSVLNCKGCYFFNDKDKSCNKTKDIICSAPRRKDKEFVIFKQIKNDKSFWSVIRKIKFKLKINKMRTFIILVLLVITALLVKVCILDNRVNTLEYKNAKLHLMIDDVVNYSDSTADTGEFDEFIDSPQGKRFFTNYRNLYDK